MLLVRTAVDLKGSAKGKPATSLSKDSINLSDLLGLEGEHDLGRSAAWSTLTCFPVEKQPPPATEVLEQSPSSHRGFFLWRRHYLTATADQRCGGIPGGQTRARGWGEFNILIRERL